MNWIMQVLCNQKHSRWGKSESRKSSPKHLSWARGASSTRAKKTASASLALGLKAGRLPSTSSCKWTFFTCSEKRVARKSCSLLLIQDWMFSWLGHCIEEIFFSACDAQDPLEFTAQSWVLIHFLCSRASSQCHLPWSFQRGEAPRGQSPSRCTQW